MYSYLEASYQHDMTQRNKSHKNFGAAIHHMPTSEWTVLQNWGTIATTHQPTIVHDSHLCQEQSQNWSLMLSTDKEYT